MNPVFMIDNIAGEATEIYNCFRRAGYLSIKQSSYFQVYEDVLRKFVGQELTLVEIGVLNGGSLFMWRSYLGPKARIIGVDFNASARHLESVGFEIHIGNQADPAFWEEFFASVGRVDVVIDDGGHTNRQQIVTVHSCLPHINDGGVILVEDVHTSYFRDFGNPSRYSFVNWAKSLVDAVNGRFPGVSMRASTRTRDCVYRVSFFESIVCLHIDRVKCVVPSWASNGGIAVVGAEDQRHLAMPNKFIGRIRKILLDDGFIARLFPVIAKRSKGLLVRMDCLSERRDSYRLRRYFE